MYPVATRQHRQGKAKKGKARQHEPRAQVTYSESSWCLAEAVASRLGHRDHGCAKFILVGIWLQGRLAPFPAANRIFINPFMVRKIEQGLLHIHLNFLGSKFLHSAWTVYYHWLWHITVAILNHRLCSGQEWHRLFMLRREAVPKLLSLDTARQAGNVEELHNDQKWRFNHQHMGIQLELNNGMWLRYYMEKWWFNGT